MEKEDASIKKAEDLNINTEEENNNPCLLNKINHKPIIMETIYSLSLNRPYMLFYLISNDIQLKSCLKNIFDNSKKVNSLSKELNQNIEYYIIFRKLKERIEMKFSELKSKISKFNEKINLVIQKPQNELTKEEIKFQKELDYIQYNLERFYDRDTFIENFIDKKYTSKRNKILELYYSSYKKSKNKKIYFPMRYYDYLNTIKKSEFFSDYYRMVPINLKDFFNDKIKEELTNQVNTIKFIFRGVSKELLKITSYYDYTINKNSLIENYFQNLLNNKERREFIDNVFYFFCNNIYHVSDFKGIKEILKSEFDKYPYITKKFRKLLQKDLDNELKKDRYNSFIKNKQQSIISEIMNDSLLKNHYYVLKGKLLSLCFDYMTTLDDLFLYNLPKEENANEIIIKTNNINESNDNNLDSEYLNYIVNKNIRQKICLICIIDRYKYSYKRNNIKYPKKYPHIHKLLFTLFSKSDFNELFMFNEIPIKDIYNIFISYFLSIKNFENIEEVSFGDEFFMNKNQFFYYNDEYYQSIVSYLIDQYLINCKIINNNGNNILGNIKTKKLEINENKLHNIYERFKIIYGFNKLFPNLENKKILELSYINDIKNTNIVNNYINCNYKIILIDFNNNIPLKENINNIIENIKDFIFKNLQYQLNNIEMISFININLITEDNNKININNNFDFLPNLKEFFINNNTKYTIPNNICKAKLFYKFEYVYLGYDEKDNLIFYRNGKNIIKSIDILDLFNIFNNKIRKLNLKYENIAIIFNSDKSILKIINQNYNNGDNNLDNIYNYSLSNLSDFIYNQNNINDLIIEGFDFTFEEIQNKNIKKLSINYNDNNAFVNYNINISKLNHFKLDIDINLVNKFPQLEELSIGNIKNEKFLFNQLFISKNFSNNLKNINIITYCNFKFRNIDNTNVKTNIIIKSNINLNNNQEEEEEYEMEEEENEDDEGNYDDNENDDLFVDKYQDILEDSDPVITKNVQIKKRKINKEQNKEENKEIILVKEKLLPYKKIEENLFKKDIESYLSKENIFYFDSNIIKTVNNFYLIQKSFSLVNKSIDIKKIKFNLLCRSETDKLSEYKDTKNLFVIFITEYSKIFCAYLKNENHKEKGDDFFLDLNNNEIYYHIKEDVKRKKSKNEISREKKDKKWEKNYDLKYYYLGDPQKITDMEDLFEFYKITF